MNNPYDRSGQPADPAHEMNMGTVNPNRRLNGNIHPNSGQSANGAIPERNSYRQNTDGQRIVNDNTSPSGRQRRLQNQPTGGQLPVKNGYRQPNEQTASSRNHSSTNIGGPDQFHDVYGQPTGGHNPYQNGYSQPAGRQNYGQSVYAQPMIGQTPQPNDYRQPMGGQIPAQNRQPTGGWNPQQNRQQTGGQNPLQNRQQTGGQNPLQNRQSTGGQNPLQNNRPPVGTHDRSRPLAEWQKTDPSVRPVSPWRSEADTMSDFSSSDVDPKIASERSPNLYNKNNRFWNKDETGKASDTGVNQQRAKKKNFDVKRWLKGILALAILLIVAMVIARYTFLNVSNIDVIGNETYSKEEIIRWSGVRKGMYLLSVNGKDIKNIFENEPYVVLDYVEKSVPGNVKIAVKERKPVAYFDNCGIYYTIDKDRMVLGMSEDMNSQFTGLFELKGLSLKEARVGLKLQLLDDEQGVICESLIREFRVMQCLPIIADMDLSDLKSIRLMTTEHYTIQMGDDQNIHAKLRAMTLVRERLISMGLTEGTIDVRDYEHPVYIYPV